MTTSDQWLAIDELSWVVQQVVDSVDQWPTGGLLVTNGLHLNMLAVACLTCIFGYEACHCCSGDGTLGADEQKTWQQKRLTSCDVPFSLLVAVLESPSIATRDIIQNAHLWSSVCVHAFAYIEYIYVWIDGCRWSKTCRLPLLGSDAPSCCPGTFCMAGVNSVSNEYLESCNKEPQWDGQDRYRRVAKKWLPFRHYEVAKHD